MAEDKIGNHGNLEERIQDDSHDAKDKIGGNAHAKPNHENKNNILYSLQYGLSEIKNFYSSMNNGFSEALAGIFYSLPGFNYNSKSYSSPKNHEPAAEPTPEHT